jgi:hypothetical protein
VEQIFSHFKAIKTERRTKLKTKTLNDLLEINIEGPEFSTFAADKAIELWWNSQTRRINQSERKEYTRQGASTDTDTIADSNDAFTLDDWDDWMTA